MTHWNAHQLETEARIKLNACVGMHEESSGKVEILDLLPLIYVICLVTSILNLGKRYVQKTASRWHIKCLHYIRSKTVLLWIFAFRYYIEDKLEKVSNNFLRPRSPFSWFFWLSDQTQYHHYLVLSSRTERFRYYKLQHSLFINLHYHTK